MVSKLINLWGPDILFGGDGEIDSKDKWDKTVTETFGSYALDDLGWDSVSSWSTGLTNRASDGGSGGDTFQSPVISDLIRKIQFTSQLCYLNDIDIDLSRVAYDIISFVMVTCL